MTLISTFYSYGYLTFRLISLLIFGIGETYNGNVRLYACVLIMDLKMFQEISVNVDRMLWAKNCNMSQFLKKAAGLMTQILPTTIFYEEFFHKSCHKSANKSYLQKSRNVPLER